MSGAATALPTVASPTQYILTSAPAPSSSSSKSKWTLGLVLIALTLSFLFLINRVKMLDLRLRSNEAITRDLVTQDDVADMVEEFANQKLKHLLWSESDIRALIDEHVTDALSQLSPVTTAATVPAPPPPSSVEPEPEATSTTPSS